MRMRHYRLSPGFFLLVSLVAAPRPSGAQVPAGPEFQINSHTTSHQSKVDVALLPAGGFVASWRSFLQDGSYHGIFGQQFDSAGARVGPEFQVNTFTPGRQYELAVTGLASGAFVVTWDGPTPDGQGTAIFGQRYDPSGARLGAEFQISTDTRERSPTVARGRGDEFVVVWYDFSFEGIWARRYDGRGRALADPFRLNEVLHLLDQDPSVARLPGGGFVVVWVGREWSQAHLFGRRFDASGAPLGSDFQVSTGTVYPFAYPSVAADGRGAFVVAWYSDVGGRFGVFGRRFDPSGAPAGSEFQVNPVSIDGYLADVAADEVGNFVVTWTAAGDGGSGRDIFARRYHRDGTSRGGEFRVNDYTTGIQGESQVASDSFGNLILAWTGVDADGENVKGQRLGVLRAEALAVDSVGNRILEPGETVDVRPSWRNRNGAAQTFVGRLSNLTGPAGASYAIVDGDGDYGTVPDGAVQPCGGCYAVSVSNPAPRPAFHWDAAVTEALLPDVHGQHKAWALHVGRSFSDVPAGSPFYPFVETLLHRSVTAGCGAADYCPSASTSREQMAVFVLAAREGAEYRPAPCSPPNLFVDVPEASPFCPWIQELAERGVAAGCGGGRYCPGAPVSREQMAVFVLRTLDAALLPPACAPPNLFTDVPETSPFCPWIEELARRGVVTGCEAGRYCPSASVTREQMAVFLSGTFALSLYGV